MNKFNIFIINLVLALLFFLVALSGLFPAFSFIDEILLIIFFISVLSYGFVGLMYGRVYQWLIFLILYFLIQFINYYFSPFGLNLFYVLLQSIISVKLFLGILFAYILIKEGIINKKLIDFMWISIVLLFIIGILSNWIIGESWNNYFTDRIRYRYGILRPVGFFGDVGVNGYIFSLFFITYVLSFRYKYKNLITSKKGLIIVVLNLIASFVLTLRKNLVMIIPVFFSFIKGLKGISKLFGLLLASFFLFFMVFIAYKIGLVDDVYNGMINDESSYIRGLMFVNGFSLMFEFFPLGVGSGTFGTFMSNYQTLEVYKYVGINLRHFTDSDGSLRGVYDSGLGSFVAENGFLGLIIIIMFIRKINASIKSLFDSKSYEIYLVLISFSLILTISEPIMQSGFFTVFFIINLLKIHSNRPIVE